MPGVTILEGDCVEQMRRLEAGSVHAVVTDPPYNYDFMSKNWDTAGTPAEFQAWCQQWAAEALRVLKPGGWLVSFGGTRTYHRMACGVEDAGFEVRDCISWVYASGFPKSLSVGRAIDKAVGAEREVAGEGTPVRRLRPGADQNRTGDWTKLEDRTYTPQDTLPATPEAEAWQGWGTALKPAQEPILLARKPLAAGSTVASNVQEHGTGALNIDATRIAAAGGSPSAARRAASRKSGNAPTRPGVKKPDQIVSRTHPEVYMAARPSEELGRWPANLLLSHAAGCERVGTKRVKGITGTAAGRAAGKDSDVYGGGWTGGMQNAGEPIGFADADGLEEVEDWRCAEGCPVAELDRQSGQQRSGVAVQRHGGGQQMFGGIAPGRSAGGQQRPDAGYGDFGGASRFFFCAKAPASERWFLCRDCGVVARKTDDAEPDADCPLHGDNPETADFGPLFGGTENPACACPSAAREQHAGHDVEMHPCLEPGSLVMTDRGFREIETLVVGDRVYSDDGKFHGVEDVSSHLCDGEIFEIAVSGTNLSVRATGNHPFLACRPTIASSGGRVVDKSVAFVRADELRVGDYLMTPLVSEQPPVDVPSDPEFWWAAGLWVAEGCFQKAGHGASRYLVYSLSDTEQAFVDRLRRVFGDDVVKVYPSTEGAASMAVMVFRPEFADQFESWFGYGSGGKFIRGDVLGLPDDCARALLDGYLDGDGYRLRRGRRAKTVSRALASCLGLLAERLGHTTSVRREESTTTGIGGRKFKSVRPHYVVTVSDHAGSRRGPPKRIDHEGVSYAMRRVREIARESYRDLVWNLTVEGRHTFQTSVGMSHNTVKPLGLMRWLCRLVSVPGGTVLDPFMGSGTTAEAAVAEGMEFVGCEMHRPYIDLARARLGLAE